MSAEARDFVPRVPVVVNGLCVPESRHEDKSRKAEAGPSNLAIPRRRAKIVPPHFIDDIDPFASQRRGRVIVPPNQASCYSNFTDQPTTVPEEIDEFLHNRPLDPSLIMGYFMHMMKRYSPWTESNTVNHSLMTGLHTKEMWRLVMEDKRGNTDMVERELERRGFWLDPAIVSYNRDPDAVMRSLNPPEPYLEPPRMLYSYPLVNISKEEAAEWGVHQEAAAVIHQMEIDEMHRADIPDVFGLYGPSPVNVGCFIDNSPVLSSDHASYVLQSSKQKDKSPELEVRSFIDNSPIRFSDYAPLIHQASEGKDVSPELKILARNVERSLGIWNATRQRSKASEKSKALAGSLDQALQNWRRRQGLSSSEKNGSSGSMWSRRSSSEEVIQSFLDIYEQPGHLVSQISTSSDTKQSSNLRDGHYNVKSVIPEKKDQRMRAASHSLGKIPTLLPTGPMAHLDQFEAHLRDAESLVFPESIPLPLSPEHTLRAAHPPSPEGTLRVRTKDLQGDFTRSEGDHYAGLTPTTPVLVAVKSPGKLGVNFIPRLRAESFPLAQSPKQTRIEQAHKDRSFRDTEISDLSLEEFSPLPASIHRSVLQGSYKEVSTQIGASLATAHAPHAPSSPSSKPTIPVPNHLVPAHGNRTLSHQEKTPWLVPGPPHNNENATRVQNRREISRSRQSLRSRRRLLSARMKKDRSNIEQSLLHMHTRAPDIVALADAIWATRTMRGFDNKEELLCELERRDLTPDMQRLATSIHHHEKEVRGAESQRSDTYHDHENWRNGSQKVNKRHRGDVRNVFPQVFEDETATEIPNQPSRQIHPNQYHGHDQVLQFDETESSAQTLSTSEGNNVFEHVQTLREKGKVEELIKLREALERTLSEEKENLQPIRQPFQPPVHKSRGFKDGAALKRPFSLGEGKRPLQLEQRLQNRRSREDSDDTCIMREPKESIERPFDNTLVGNGREGEYTPHEISFQPDRVERIKTPPGLVRLPHGTTMPWHLFPRIYVPFVDRTTINPNSRQEPVYVHDSFRGPEAPSVPPGPIGSLRNGPVYHQDPSMQHSVLPSPQIDDCNLQRPAPGYPLSFPGTNGLPFPSHGLGVPSYPHQQLGKHTFQPLHPQMYPQPQIYNAFVSSAAHLEPLPATVLATQTLHNRIRRPSSPTPTESGPHVLSHTLSPNAAAHQLAEFKKKFPMTGTNFFIENVKKTNDTKKGNAAAVQQRLELLLLQKREKKKREVELDIARGRISGRAVKVEIRRPGGGSEDVSG